MFKLSVQQGDETVAHSHPPVYRLETASHGTPRLVIGVPGGDAAIFQALAAGLPEPFFLLYILHTPRGEGEPGRYLSPAIDRAALIRFMERYGPFLSGDGRHDFWIHSPEAKATLAWDRHNLLYAYGPPETFVERLKASGFHEGEPNAAFTHVHHYRDEFDGDAAALLAEFDWRRSPLRPEDEQ